MKVVSWCAHYERWDLPNLPNLQVARAGPLGYIVDVQSYISLLGSSSPYRKPVQTHSHALTFAVALSRV
jgi:hypothetical protein